MINTFQDGEKAFEYFTGRKVKGLFHPDRIGNSVRCKVVHGSKQRGETVDYGYVKWTHAIKGQIVKSLEVINFGHMPGPWIIEEVDVPFIT